MEKYKQALQQISALWPEPPNCADILSVSGINDGKSRAILLDAAIKIARKALAQEWFAQCARCLKKHSADSPEQAVINAEQCNHDKY